MKNLERFFFFFLLKYTNRENTFSTKTQILKENMNMDIWLVGKYL